MIIKEEGTHIDPTLQANFSEFAIARGKAPKQSLYSRGLSQIYEEFPGTGWYRRISRQWEKEAEEIISRITG